MKKTMFLFAMVILMAACTTAICPTYSQAGKTKQGAKSQLKYARTHNKKSFLAL